MIRQAQHVLAVQRETNWISISGCGEPTLYASLGYLIRRVKELTGLPVVVNTNGALMVLPEVRQELYAADLVIPTLSAGNAELFQKLNRPQGPFTLECFVDGLTAFRKEFSGKLCIEVMMVRGYNDNQAALRDIANILARIQPDEIQISLPTLPPTESWVQNPDREGLMHAEEILGQFGQLWKPGYGPIVANSAIKTAQLAKAGLISSPSNRLDPWAVSS
jgi:wyosine [tRNA(Phe)-imidazoG37] synthetase (radical SAM superfamily)